MNHDKKIKIAIDGPAGAGKSTVAKIVAKELDYIYIDTGAMYRALTLKALKNNINLDDAQQLAQMAQDTELDLKKKGQGLNIELDGNDVTDQIRTNQVSNQVSSLAKHKVIRSELLKFQRKIAKKGRVVMDGRDIGTVVLPDAQLKIYLTASADERARRRYDEMKVSENVSLSEIKEEIIKRDQADRNREVAPLKKAEDAVEIDTTNLDIKAVVDKIIDLFQEV